MEDAGRIFWAVITGRTPALSIEITKECPLKCPGCYAFEDGHLGGDGVTLRSVADYRGAELIRGVLDLVDEVRPLHVSIVGGEPMVHCRELEVLLPQLAERRLHVQLVTSAVRSIPAAFRSLRRLSIVVSIDGLQPEHDVRRAPATYERILKNIDGHKITVHCTATRQQLGRDNYFDEFLAFWSNHPSVEKIWISLYTPQRGEVSAERLTPDDRRRATDMLLRLRGVYPKLALPAGLINVYAKPPASPEECVFARMTEVVTADLKRRVTPCQFGGIPECNECGCVASAGLEAIARHRLGGILPVRWLLDGSHAVGRLVAGASVATAPETS